jgi:hypothetical protein
MAQLLENLEAQHWEGHTPGSGFNRMRWLQGLSDLVNRPVNNRANATTNATAVNCTGAVLSSGIGIQQLQPKRYSEFTVKARVTFNINSAGPAFVYVYRTLGAVPANGAAPNVGDVIVAGDAFIGGPTSAGVNQSGALSFLDTGLDVSKRYRYYLAVKGPNATVLNLVNASQLLVMERS